MLKKFFKFGISSGIATLFDLILFFIFTEFVGIYYLLSAALSFLGGSSLNYGLNKIFVFANSKRKHLTGLISFLAIGAIGLIWTILLMALFVEFFGVNYLIARLLAACLVLIWNYLLNSLITFR